MVFAERQERSLLLLSKPVLLIFIISLGVALSVQAATSLNVIDVADLLKLNPTIQHIKVHDPISFRFEPFPLSRDLQKQPNTGLIDVTFILTIPQGYACSSIGSVVVDQKYIIKELLGQNYLMSEHRAKANKISFEKFRKVSGRVAVIAASDSDVYAHWMRDILGRLAMLEIAGIEYDWLYVPMYKPYMKDTLRLWGVDLKKIIQPEGEFCCVQADELIVPSLIAYRVAQPGENFSDYAPLSNYYTPWVIDYVRQKFLPLIEKWQGLPGFSKKVYISRKDGRYRKVINEDELFELFEKKGFQRYELSAMPLLEQIYLFKNADIIVAPHGSNFANLLFCDTKTKVIEIFQSRDDSSECYLSQMMGLQYHYIKTADFLDGFPGFTSTVVPLNIIQDFIDQNEQLFS